jgi:YHS domain-containing protein
MKRYFWLLLILVIHTKINAQSVVQRTKHFNLESGVAIQGYDPVAYFTENKAVKGNEKNSTNFSGVTYYFESQNNKELFLKNPTQYEPQYGGWCAFAMGDYGKKVEINPKTFKIYEGKLYLFYNAYFTNTLKSWNKNEVNLKKQADNNWSSLLKNK